MRTLKSQRNMAFTMDLLRLRRPDSGHPRNKNAKSRIADVAEIKRRFINSASSSRFFAFLLYGFSQQANGSICTLLLQ